MKKLILSIVVSAGLLLALPLSASANRASTFVTGVISNNGRSVEDAKVTVVCNGHSQRDTTNRFGMYKVQFKLAQCPDGSTVTVTATKNHKGGTNSGTVHNETTKLNVATVDVSVPEFGTLAAIAAAVVAVGSLFFIRRRHLNQA